MKLKEVYEYWLPVKNKQVKASTLSVYKMISLVSTKKS